MAGAFVKILQTYQLVAVGKDAVFLKSDTEK